MIFLRRTRFTQNTLLWRLNVQGPSDLHSEDAVQLMFDTNKMTGEFENQLGSGKFPGFRPV